MLGYLAPMQCTPRLHSRGPDRSENKRVVELKSSQASSLESLSKMLASFKIALVILWVECRKGTLGGTLTTLLQDGQ